MAIFARRNTFIVSTQSTSVLPPISPPITPAWDDHEVPTIFPDNAGSDNSITMSNLGTGVNVYEQAVAIDCDTTDYQFNTLTAGSNVTITKNAGNIQISANVVTSGGVIVVADIPARNALILATDTLVFVQSDLDNEYSMYLWDNTNTIFKKLATEDSAEAHALSLSYTLNFNSPTTITLGNASPGARVVDVSVRVIVPFDGSPTLTIGDDINGHDILMDYSVIDLNVADQYFTESNFTYTGTLDTDIKAYFNAGSSTIGQAQIIVSYV